MHERSRANLHGWWHNRVRNSRHEIYSFLAGAAGFFDIRSSSACTSLRFATAVAGALFFLPVVSLLNKLLKKLARTVSEDVSPLTFVASALFFACGVDSRAPARWPG